MFASGMRRQFFGVVYMQCQSTYTAMRSSRVASLDTDDSVSAGSRRSIDEFPWRS